MARKAEKTDRQKDGRADSLMNGQIKRELNGQTDLNRLIDRQTKILTDRHTDRQTDKPLREVTDLRKEGINKDERVKEKGHLSTGDPQITIN